MILIERYDYSSFKKQYTLDGVLFYIHLYWVERNSSWYMNIENTNEVIIYSGIRLVCLIGMLETVRSKEGLPAGDFYLKKKSGDSSVLTYDNFGTEFILNYYTKKEVDALAS